MEKEFYKKVQEQFNRRVSVYENHAFWTDCKELIQAHIDFLKGLRFDKILDLCCGTGIIGHSVCKKYGTIFGLDVSLNMLEKANRKIDFCINGLAEKIPFKNNSFDLVICRQALHFLSLGETFDEISRILRQEGIVIISQIVPFNEQDQDWLFRIHSEKQPLLRNFLSKEIILGFLKERGFSDIEEKELIIRESVLDWLDLSPELNKVKKDKVKKLYKNAPVKYKRLHDVKIFNGKIQEDMRWIITKATKAWNG